MALFMVALHYGLNFAQAASLSQRCWARVASYFRLASPGELAGQRQHNLQVSIGSILSMAESDEQAMEQLLAIAERSLFTEQDLVYLLARIPRGVAVKGVKQGGIGKLMRRSWRGVMTASPRVVFDHLDIMIVYHALRNTDVISGQELYDRLFPKIAEIVRASAGFEQLQVAEQNDILGTLFRTLSDRAGLDLWAFETGGTGRYLDYLFTYTSGDDQLRRLVAFFHKAPGGKPWLNDGDLRKIVRNMPRGRALTEQGWPYELITNDVNKLLGRSWVNNSKRWCPVSHYILYQAIKHTKKVEDPVAMVEVGREIMDIMESSLGLFDFKKKFHDDVLQLFERVIKAHSGESGPVQCSVVPVLGASSGRCLEGSGSWQRILSQKFSRQSSVKSIEERSHRLRATIRNVFASAENEVQVIEQLLVIAQKNKFSERDLLYLLERIPRAVAAKARRFQMADFLAARGQLLSNYYDGPFFGQLDIMIVYHALRNTDTIFDQKVYAGLFPVVEDILRSSLNWMGAVENTRWGFLYAMRRTYGETAHRVMGEKNVVGSNISTLRWIQGMGDDYYQYKLNSYEQFVIDAKVIAVDELAMILADLPRGRSWRSSGLWKPLLEAVWKLGLKEWAHSNKNDAVDIWVLYQALSKLQVEPEDSSVFDYFPKIVQIIRASVDFQSFRLEFRNDILEAFFLILSNRAGPALNSFEGGGTERYLDFLFDYISGKDLTRRLAGFLQSGSNPQLRGRDLLKIIRYIPRQAQGVHIVHQAFRHTNPVANPTAIAEAEGEVVEIYEFYLRGLGDERGEYDTGEAFFRGMMRELGESW